MDNAVAAAYGWSDLELGHGFHETAQGVRYTLSESARREVLARLLKLNLERWEEEQKNLTPGPSPKGRGEKRRKKAGGMNRDYYKPTAIKASISFSTVDKSGGVAAITWSSWPSCLWCGALGKSG